MQRLATLLLLTVLLIPSAHAQLSPADQKAVDQVAFELTKVTVEFIATDKKTFGNLAKTTCDTCTSYEGLIQFIKSSKLAKADDLVRDAQKQVASLTTPTATADQILTGLKQYLHTRATTGDERERRTKLPSYATYQTQVAQMLSDAGVEEITNQVASTPADTTDMGDSIPPVSSVTKADAGILSFGGLALVLSLLNLVGLVYLWSLRGKKTTSTSLADTQLAEVSRRMVTLETERKDLLNRMTRLERSLASTTERPAPAPAPRPLDPVVTKPTPTVLAPEPLRQAQAIPPVTLQPTPAPRPATAVPAPQPLGQKQAAPSNQPRRRETVFYGRTADLGDGFSVGSLFDAPNREVVFQIEVRTESQAVYQVMEEPGAQQLALSDPYSYLADACEYMAKPMPNARIRTNQPGQLALQGDKWKIVEKAKISFY